MEDPAGGGGRDPACTPSHLSFPVVGLGASAGGLAALGRFFEAAPADMGMAFVVILHLSPKHASQVDQLLGKLTAMPVRQVREATRIEANHVYVIAPSLDLAMNDGYLRVTEARRPLGRHVAIDLFFRTLALVHRDRAVAVVLSGSGADGATGITRVKEQGGITLAQSPLDAEHDGMPRAAIATGMIDWILPVAEMPQKLLELWQNARRMQLPAAAPGDDEDASGLAALPSSERAARDAEEALVEVMVLLRTRTGHDFRHYKRATVLRRLERRMQVHAVPDLPAYRQLLRTVPDETNALLKDLLIGVTNFFRDRPAFEALERSVVPELFGPGHGGTLRAWAPGCATGEEAYSIAMLLAEHAELTSTPMLLQVFATDIDEQAIAMGREGIYPESIVADVPPARLRRWFTRDGHRYRLRQEVRERVLFAAHNVLRDPPFSKLDLVSCRNLLIYLDRRVQAEVLELFHFALRPGGYLFLGSSETADAAEGLFSVVDKQQRIFRANPVKRPVRASVGLPNAPRLRTSAAMLTPPRERGKATFAEMHLRLLEDEAPPSALLDAEGDIVHLSGAVGRYLRLASGEPSHQLLGLVLPALRAELRTALFQLQQGTVERVETRHIPVELADGPAAVAIKARRVPEAGGTQRMLLVLFQEQPADGVAAGIEPAAAPRAALAEQFEEELRRTKEQLQLTIEQAETSMEELTASNEELQSINEEMRSTTEELETSKEELQSINEELVTVNHELKVKVEETGKINDDLQNLIASTDIATVFVDGAMAIKRYTPRAAQIFSIIPGDLGRSLLDITHKLDYPELPDAAAQAFRSLRTSEREVASSDGRWYLARVLPYRTSEDRIDGAVLTFVDVTTRRLAEANLRAGEERMRLISESVQDYAIITLDPDGLVVAWSQGAERLFGWSESEAVGRDCAVVFTPEDRERGQPEHEMRTARLEGRAEDDRWHLRKDGKRFYCSGVMYPLFDGGALRGYAKIARDATGLKHAEREREALLALEAQRRAEAQAASNLKDEFLAVMSHELKNPLNLIQLSVDLLASLDETRKVSAVERATATIRKAVRGQAQIIDDLLDLSRMNTGKLSLSREPVDWVEIVQNIVAAVQEQAAGKGLSIEWQRPAEPFVIDADRVRIEQIVWNLLTNAVRFTPSAGRIVLRLERHDGLGVLEVQDNGRGIEPALLPRVFDMFQQGGGQTARGDRGLGIGLALVKHLVELHGGRVACRSDGRDQGAVFTVALPLGEAVDTTDAPAPALWKGLAGLRVLTVDDEAENLELLRSLLELAGLRVTSAGSGREALALAAQHEFDLVLSDVGMPGMDGYAFLEELRRLYRYGTTPVVALTGFGRPADEQRALAAGFAAHLGKPLVLETLMSTIAGLAGRGVAGTSAR